MAYAFENVIKGKKVVILQEDEKPVDLGILVKQIESNGSLNWFSVNRLMNYNSDFMRMTPDNPYLIVRVHKKDGISEAEVYAGKNKKSVKQLPGFYVAEKEEDIDADKELARAAKFVKKRYLGKIDTFRKRIDFRNYALVALNIEELSNQREANGILSAQAKIKANVAKPLSTAKAYRNYCEMWEAEVEPYLMDSNPQNRWKASKALVNFNSILSKGIEDVHSTRQDSASLASASALALTEMIADNSYERVTADYSKGILVLVNEPSIKGARIEHLVIPHIEQRIFMDKKAIARLENENMAKQSTNLWLEYSLPVSIAFKGDKDGR
jgi:hypothetical protein